MTFPRLAPVACFCLGEGRAGDGNAGVKGAASLWVVKKEREGSRIESRETRKQLLTIFCNISQYSKRQKPLKMGQEFRP